MDDNVQFTTEVADSDIHAGKLVCTFFNQACIGLWPVYTWFLKIVSVQTLFLCRCLCVVCLCVCTRMHVSAPEAISN